MFAWIVANWSTVIVVVLAVIGAASAAVKVIAPLTKTTRDDRLAKWLDVVVSWLSKVALNPRPEP